MLRFVSVPLEIDEIYEGEAFTVFEARRTEKGSQPTPKHTSPSRDLIT